MPSKPKPNANPYDIAARVLARREHARGELARKLARRGFDSTEIDDALDRLASDGYLSDERFTEQFVRGRFERGAGPARIRSELNQRGVADGLIDDALDDYASEWLQRVREVRRKRFGDAIPSEYRERARQARFLQSRGFTADQIGRELNDD